MTEPGPPSDDNTAEGAFARPFADFLRAQREGSLHNEVTEALHALVDGVITFAKPGELTIKFKVKPGPRGNADTVVISDSVVVKIPEAERDAAIYFVDESGNLTRDNPLQPSLPLRAVPTAAEAVHPAGSELEEHGS